MNIKIKKYQTGGFITNIYQPVTVTPSVDPATQLAINALMGGFGGSGKASSSSSSKSSSKDDLTKKGLFDLYSMIKDTGLQSDADVVIDQLQKDLFNSELLDPMGSSDNLAIQYTKALRYLNKTKSNEKEYDNAYNKAQAKGALVEYAITPEGGVIAKNLRTGVIEQIKPETYWKNPRAYQLQTNGNLLAERRENKKLAFNNTYINIVENSTSMKEIMDTIKDITTGLGTDEAKLEGYTKEELGQIQGGLAILDAAASKLGSEKVASLISVGGLYKLGIVNKDQERQVQSALGALFSTLPENQKTLLKLKAGGTDEALFKLLTAIVTKNTSNTFNLDVDLQKDEDGSGTNGASGLHGDFKGVTFSQAERYYLGLGEKKNISFMNGTQHSFTVRNSVTSPLLDNSGNSKATPTTAKALTEGNLSLQFNTNQISIGNQTVPGEYLNLIQIHGELTSADLPIDVEAYQKNIIRPDFKHLKTLEEADKAVKAAGIDTSIIEKAVAVNAAGQELSDVDKSTLKSVVDKVNKIYKDKGLHVKYDDNGNLTTYYKRFTMVNAVAPSTILDEKEAKEAGMEEITDQNRVDEILNILNNAQGGGDKKSSIKFNKKGFMDTYFGPLGLGYDKMYEGVLFVPMKDNFLDIYTGKLSPQLANVLDAQEDYRNAVKLQGSFKE